MSPRALQRSASALMFLIVGIVVVGMCYFHDALLAGIVYLVASDFICFLCMILASKLRAHRDKPVALLNIKARVYLIIAVQMAIVGILNIAAQYVGRSHALLALSYLLLAVFLIASYKLLSIADTVEQLGGYEPLTFGKINRSRRLFYISFFLIGIMPSLSVASIVFFIHRGGWHPVPSKLPQICLLMAAISAVMTAWLLYQRYRNQELRKISNGSLIAIVLSILLCAAGFEAIFSFGSYTYVLSAIIVISNAIVAWCIWRSYGPPEDEPRGVVNRPMPDSIRSPS